MNNGFVISTSDGQLAKNGHNKQT